MNRSNKGDKISKDSEGKVIKEELAFTCRKCGAKWKQSVDYKKSGRKAISWRKVA